MTFATYAALEFNEIKVGKLSEFTILYKYKATSKCFVETIRINK
jgi:hypothetical protein